MSGERAWRDGQTLNRAIKGGGVFGVSPSKLQFRWVGKITWQHLESERREDLAGSANAEPSGKGRRCGSMGCERAAACGASGGERGGKKLKAES